MPQVFTCSRLSLFHSLLALCFGRPALVRAERTHRAACELLPGEHQVGRWPRPHPRALRRGQSLRSETTDARPVRHGFSAAC